MKAELLIGGLAMVLAIGGAAAQSSPKPGSNSETVSAAQDATAAAVGAISAEMTSTTKGFVEAAAISDMYEVQAGTIAAARGQSPAVRDFGKQMVEAHTATTNQLKGILASNKINVIPPPKLDARRQGMLDNLKGAAATDFDNRYITQQVAAHKEAQILMRGYSKDGDNGAVKAFAAQTLPKVEMHLKMVEGMQKK